MSLGFLRSLAATGAAAADIYLARQAAFEVPQSVNFSHSTAAERPLALGCAFANQKGTYHQALERKLGALARAVRAQEPLQASVALTPRSEQ